MLICTVAGSCVVTTALSTHGSASTRLWIAAPLMVKMLSSGHLGGGDHGAGGDQVGARRRSPGAPGTAGSVSTSTSSATCTVSAATAIRRRLQEVPPARRRAATAPAPRRAWRRLRGDACSRVPGVTAKRAHRPGGVDDQRRLGSHQGDVARSLVEHLGAHEACSVRWGQCINAG